MDLNLFVFEMTFVGLQPQQQFIRLYVSIGWRFNSRGTTVPHRAESEINSRGTAFLTEHDLRRVTVD